MAADAIGVTIMAALVWRAVDQGLRLRPSPRAAAARAHATSMGHRIGRRLGTPAADLSIAINMTDPIYTPDERIDRVQELFVAQSEWLCSMWRVANHPGMAGR